MTDLNLLRTFSAIYRTGSVSSASKILNITSSAVSHSLSRLRVEYENPLFVREGRGLKPTTFASQLYSEIAPHLTALEGTKKLFENFDPATSDRTFHIAGDSDLDLLFFNKLLKVAKEEAPSVKIVKYQSENSEEVFNNALTMRKTDIFITCKDNDNEAFSTEQVMKDDLIAIARKGHPLLTEPLTLDRLKQEKFAFVSRPDMNLYKLEKMTNGIIPEAEMVYATTSAINILFFVADKDWLSLVPEFLYEKTKKLDLVEKLPTPFSCGEVPIVMMNHKATERDGGIRWLKGKIRESFS